MIINNIGNINFSARNKTIRRADDIARLVNREFPRVSATNLAGLKHVDSFKNCHQKLRRAIFDLRDLMAKKFSLSNNFEEMLDAVVEPIRLSKKGNCGESARLAFLAAQANGIKNCKVVGLIGPDYESYDHRVVLVNDKKPYIIDSWLGFADYVPNAIKRYQKEYRHHFDFNEYNKEKMIIDYYMNDKYFKEALSEEDLVVLNEKYPRLKLR